MTTTSTTTSTSTMNPRTNPRPFVLFVLASLALALAPFGVAIAAMLVDVSLANGWGLLTLMIRVAGVAGLFYAMLVSDGVAD